MSATRRIYLDNNAGTRPLPEVVEAMRPYLDEEFANPSSLHQFGQSARHAVECARVQVAALIGATSKEIIFTSGGTESINMALRGALAANPAKRRLVTTTVEHPAVLRVAEQLASEGVEVDCVGVDREGRVDESAWAAKLTENTGLASILHANNETGVLWDVERLAAVAAAKGIPVHVDAVQSAGKVPIDVTRWAVQSVSLAGHKFHGPKGVGALYLRRRSRLGPLIVGGGQERQLRGGTENVAGIVGMGVAAEAARREMGQRMPEIAALRDALEAGILNEFPDARVNGGTVERIANTSNISFAGLEAEAILILLSEAGIAASSGAACSSGSLEPSHVLLAMGVEDRWSHGAVRFSLSRFNTRAEIDEVIALMPKLLGRLRALRGVSADRNERKAAAAAN